MDRKREPFSDLHWSLSNALREGRDKMLETLFTSPYIKELFPRLKNTQGFSLIEMMMVVAIFGIVLIGLNEMMIQQQRFYIMQEDVSEAQQDIRVAMQMMSSEIRRAGSHVPNTVIPVCPAAPACTNGNPDSITINITNGSSTFLIPNGSSVVDGTSKKVYVQSIAGFSTGVVNIIRPLSRALVSSHTISMGGPEALPAAIPLDTPSPDGSLLQAGDLVAQVPFTVTYSLAGGDLQRNGVSLAENIQNLQFRYISVTGVETDAPPSNPLDIRAVRITITSNTSKDVSDYNGAARTRQLSTLVKIRNFPS